MCWLPVSTGSMMNKPLKIFAAYPSYPPALSETIRIAFDRLSGPTYEITVWENARVGGKVIIGELCRLIDECDLFVADVTGINPNVMFEWVMRLRPKSRCGSSLIIPAPLPNEATSSSDFYQASATARMSIPKILSTVSLKILTPRSNRVSAIQIPMESYICEVAIRPTQIERSAKLSLATLAKACLAR